MIGTLMRLWMELMSGRSLLLLSRCLVTGEKVNTWCEKSFRTRCCGMGPGGGRLVWRGRLVSWAEPSPESRLQQQCR